MLDELARAADLVLLRELTPDTEILSKRVLPAVSALADHGRLWLGAAGVLALAGGQRGRRAAAEGAVALGLAATVVNGPLKQVVRRRRPGTGIGRLLVLERGRVPRTSSMPSGHATSAAAFTVAAGAAMPAVGLPLVGATALVGWSRINAGRHFPSDVVVGIAVGAAVGAGVHVVAERLWPHGEVSSVS